MIDVALCLDWLTPGAAYDGSLTEDHITRRHKGDSKEAYQALRWGDTTQIMPAWVELEDLWPEIQATLAETANQPTVEERLEKLERELPPTKVATRV